VHWRKSTNSKEAKSTNSQEEKMDRILMRILEQFSESESVFNEASKLAIYLKFKKPICACKESTGFNFRGLQKISIS
jgi:hypothetical protein